jgi:hypothetical protein
MVRIQWQTTITYKGRLCDKLKERSMPRFKWKTNATKDAPDLRDWPYRPALPQLRKRLDPPGKLEILDQQTEGACTGFALAAAINLQYRRQGEEITVSPRMLYEMAKRFDEWPGEDYDSTSLRGAIKGWANMGVCEQSYWPYRVNRRGNLTIRRAKNARRHTLGAYYRIEPEIDHYHAALNETGVIVVSAGVHEGWVDPKRGVIEPGGRSIGGHSFAVVGYNEHGFWVQNSWGEDWGDRGLALWKYEDWLENVWDAWVFRPALPTPQVFGRKPKEAAQVGAAAAGSCSGKVQRGSIAGHFVHVDDGHYHESGRYWSTAHDVEQTARLVAGSSRYDHLLVYVHGGLNSPQDSARRIHCMKEVFKANRVYPFHVMYDTGLAEELKDLVRRKEEQARERVAAVSDVTDRFIEGALRCLGGLVWDEMKRDAVEAFAPEGAAADALGRFLAHFKKQGGGTRLHLVGHSAGAIALGSLLRTFRRRELHVYSCSLMAPACTLDWYAQCYRPVLSGGRRLHIRDMAIYNLTDELERKDTVAAVYRKSLLYLISNALEAERGTPLLGMERFSRGLPPHRGMPAIHYADGKRGEATRATSHDGFDNDPVTLNHILARVLGKSPARPFTKADLRF